MKNETLLDQMHNIITYRRKCVERRRSFYIFAISPFVILAVAIADHLWGSGALDIADTIYFYCLFLPGSLLSFAEIEKYTEEIKSADEWLHTCANNLLDENN